jgi:hypothetical protein
MVAVILGSRRPLRCLSADARTSRLVSFDPSETLGDLHEILAPVRERGAIPKLRLWHQVSVVPSTDQVYEYGNCHPYTGLLAYLPFAEITS